MQRVLVRLVYLAVLASALAGALTGALGCGGKAETSDGTCESGQPLCGSLQNPTCCVEGEQCCPYNFESTACYPADEPCPEECGFSACRPDEWCLHQFLPPPVGTSRVCVPACPSSTMPCGDDLCCGTNARCTTEGTCEYVAPPDGGPGLPDGGAMPPDAGVAVPPDTGAARDATMLP